MKISKSGEYFNPSEIGEKIHIIGCGAVGSALAENMVRLGIQDIILWDDDIVEDKNMNNQMYFESQILKEKVCALAETLQGINPDAINCIYNCKWTAKEKLTGYVFSCVDSIEVRKEIVNYAMDNIPEIKGVFDFRMRLTDAQHYAAPGEYKKLQYLLKTMNFTDEEAKNETPQSACHELLNMCYTTRTIVALGLANFVNFLKDKKLYKMVQINTNPLMLDSFEW